MNRVFIIHGWTYNLDKWTALVELLEKSGIKTKLLKVPGLTSPSNKIWSIDDYIDWLNDELKNTKDPIVIGHSNGGRIALSYIQQHPQVIKQLILIDSAGIPHNERRSLMKLKILRIMSKVGKLFSYIPPLKKMFYKAIGAQDYFNASPNMKVTMQNMLQADSHIILSKIKLPTTIIWGRNDAITPLEDGQKMHSGITGSKLHIVDDARHTPFFNHPAVVAGLIIQAIQEKV